MTVREFLLPDLGEGLEDAEVVTWRVAQGDHVELNQVLVEVNTAKALVEIPAPWEGVVQELLAPEGAVVKVGQPLVSIRLAAPGDGATPATAREKGQPVPASPPVRRLAKELGVDLSTVPGSGPGGRVTREDVLQVAGHAVPVPSAE